MAEDRPYAHQGLVEALTREGFEVSLQTASLPDTLDALRAGHDAHLLLLALNGWPEVLSHAKRERPDLPVLVLSSGKEREIGLMALQAGASGFVRRRAKGELAKAVRRVAAGEGYASPELAGAMAEAVASGRGLAAVSATAILSARQTQAVRLYAQGTPRPEIAERMSIARATVTEHLRRARIKLKLKKTADLIRYAIRHGLINDEDLRP